MIENRTHLSFYILIASLFVIITAPALFSEGMVMDGVLYASISRNMANGLGTFWKPFLSYGLFPEFYEHPPLALGLQSLWFRVFGDSIYVELFYSLFTYFFMGLIIMAIWKQFTKSYKTGWIPLLFYFSMLKISWACANNMLENTMSVFIGLSVLLYLKGIYKNKLIYILLSGVFLFLASLTKGFVGLYIWGFPLFYWLFNRNIKFSRMVVNSLLLIILTSLPFALFILFWSDASNFLITYFNKQVLGSIQNVVTTDNRFFIVVAVLYHSIPSLLIGLLFIIVAFIKKIELKLILTNYKIVIPFILLVFGGVLPLTISMKQSGHYAITVYPYIAIAVGLTLFPIIEALFEKINFNSKQYKIFTLVSYSTALFAILFSFAQVGKLRYEKERVTDCKLIIEEIGRDKIINICPEMFVEWSLHGYMARYGNISLTANQNQTHEYLITDSRCGNLNITKNYQEITINTKDYKLYKKK